MTKLSTRLLAALSAAGLAVFIAPAAADAMSARLTKQVAAKSAVVLAHDDTGGDDNDHA